MSRETIKQLNMQCVHVQWSTQSWQFEYCVYSVTQLGPNWAVILSSTTILIKKEIHFTIARRVCISGQGPGQEKRISD